MWSGAVALVPLGNLIQLQQLLHHDAARCCCAAGDRFRETYYWDSYWVARGLLVSGMTDTATSLVDNLLAMLRAVGHVPNGARVYYLNRR